MKLATLSFFVLLVTLSPARSMGAIDYLVSYSVLRDYSAKHAPYAITRNLREWPPWKPKVIELTNSRVLWPRFSTRSPSLSEKPSRAFFEPLAYYLFMPLVEIDCTLNGHPTNRSYDWKFFGDNYDQ